MPALRLRGFGVVDPVRKLRDLLSLVALLALTGVCAASFYQAWVSRTASAQKLDRGQLIDWLLSRDVTKELRAVRLRLARRLIEDLREGHDWPSEARALPRDERDRLRKNLRDLAGVWLVSQADQYARLPDADRGAFLDDRLKDLTSLPVFAGGEGLSLASNAGAAVHEFEDWARDLPPDDDQRLRQLLSALYVRWLQQGFQRFLPGQNDG